MALKIEKEFFGVVMSPRREDVYDNGGGVLYPRVVELHHAGEKNGMLLATFDYYTVKEPPVAPIYWQHRPRQDLGTLQPGGGHQKRLRHPVPAGAV